MYFYLNMLILKITKYLFLKKDNDIKKCGTTNQWKKKLSILRVMTNRRLRILQQILLMTNNLETIRKSLYNTKFGLVIEICSNEPSEDANIVELC